MKRSCAVVCLLLASCAYTPAQPAEQADTSTVYEAEVTVQSVSQPEPPVQLEETGSESAPDTTDFTIEIVDSSKEIYDREYRLSRKNSEPLVFEGRMFYGEPLLTGFDNIMGYDGVAVRTAFSAYGGEDAFENYLDYFCVDINGRIVCIAEQFGWRNCGDYDSNSYNVDIDGDGVDEFITNNTYGADGVTEMRVYRITDGAPYVGIYAYEPKHSGRLFRKYTKYDSTTGMVQIDAETGESGDGSFVSEERPLSMDDLVFTEYKR
ncbi:MAG: hypothetical protein ILP19_01755 [Oscillospiraceae bacterium]|nr:hypothetical protein [Oscillospiraceae bacterium]